MIRARILTPWTEPNPKGNTLLEQMRRPTVLDDHRPDSWTDVTGTPAKNMPTEVPLLILEGMWDDKSWDNLINDPNYTKSILWSDDKDDKSRITLRDLSDITDHLVEVHNIPQDKVDIGLAEVKLSDDRSSVSDKLTEWLKVQEKSK